jgi:hypothetical protein
MYLTIPYQSFEVGNVHVSSFQYDKYAKTIAQFTYKDPSIDLNDVSILTPPLRVIDYNPESSRLRLDLSDHPSFLSKWEVLYENLISTFYIHQQSFLHDSSYSMESIRRLFYVLIDGPILSLYIYPTTLVKIENGTTCPISDIKTGDFLRSAVRLQGISQIISKDGLRLRLHHSVSSMWLIP